MPEPPDWIMKLADTAAGHILPLEPIAPLGCHWHYSEGVWEVSLFAGDTEIFGGSHDGERRGSRFLVDLVPLLALFSEMLDCTWQSDRVCDEDQLGCHVSLIGKHADRVVCLRVLSRAPDRFAPGRRAIAHGGVWEDLW